MDEMTAGPAPDNGEPSPGPRRRRALIVAGAGTLAAALAVGAVGIAAAANGSGSGPSTGWTPPAALGTVTSVGSNTFSMKSLGGSTVTVDVSSSTSYKEPGTTNPTFADVKVGEHVAVFGAESSGTVQATTVAVGGDWRLGPRSLRHRRAVVGTVASVGTDAFTVTPLAGGSPVTVDVSSTTKYREPGKTSASFADVTVGEHVAVAGTHTSGAVTAKAVGILPAGSSWRPPASSFGPGQGHHSGTPVAFGTVASVGAGTFTVKPLWTSSPVTVDVSSSTTYREPGKTSASFADVTVGEYVAAFGSNSSGAVHAIAVLVAPAGFFHQHFGGAGLGA
ncbi:MAG TPA: DUF5666 domain-containing protein [Acidimicrobiales bacterium]|nr:DUF5666 domain-containing protein [Acidimicrobiales bacterium]